MCPGESPFLKATGGCPGHWGLSWGVPSQEATGGCPGESPLRRSLGPVLGIPSQAGPRGVPLGRHLAWLVVVVVASINIHTHLHCLHH